jgi:prophage tail gpP-like protein
MINKATITINDRTFVYFKGLRIIESLDKFGKVFEINLNVPQEDNFNIKINDVINIDIDGERLMTGFVESFDCSATPTQRIFNIFGRDIIVDFTDSTLPNVVFKTPFNIVEALERLLLKCGFQIKSQHNKFISTQTSQVGKISIINDFGDIPNFTQEDALQYIKDVNSKSFDFIRNLANQRGIIFGTNPFGDIVIQEIGNEEALTILQCIKNDNASSNNIIESKVITNFQDRFYKYEYISSSSNGEAMTSIFAPEGQQPSKSIANDLVVKRASVIDEEVRQNRIFTKYKSSLTQAQCKDLATWELNVRKARSKIFNYKVLGFRQNLSENLSENPLWKTNQLVYVYDESQYPIVDDEFLIKTVIYKQDNNGGTICELELVDKLAYSYSVREPLIKRVRGKKEKLEGLFYKLPEDKRSL